jgi:hypothetical protein
VEIGNIKGISIGPHFSLTHLLFVDDILIFCQGSMMFLLHLLSLLDIFCKATGMQINGEKYYFFSCGMPDYHHHHFTQIIVIPHPNHDLSFKYPCFTLKSNGYVKRDWLWLVENIEK